MGEERKGYETLLGPFITFKMFTDVSCVRIFPRKRVELENVLDNITETEAMLILANTEAHQEQFWRGKQLR